MKFFSHEELIHFIETVVIIIIIRTVSFPPSHRFCAISVGGLGGGVVFFSGGLLFERWSRRSPSPVPGVNLDDGGRCCAAAKLKERERGRKEGRRERKKRFLVMAVLFYSN